MKRVLFAMSVLMVSMLACQITGISNLPQPTPVLHTQAKAPVLPTPADPAEMGTALEALYQQVLPGVVAIQTGSSLGSGFVFDSEGHVVTNQHVVEGTSEVEVDFSSGFKAHGTVIGSDTDADVAVIQVKAPADQIHPLAIGDSSVLKVGEQVCPGQDSILTSCPTGQWLFQQRRYHPDRCSYQPGQFGRPTLQFAR